MKPKVNKFNIQTAQCDNCGKTKEKTYITNLKDTNDTYCSPCLVEKEAHQCRECKNYFSLTYDMHEVNEGSFLVCFDCVKQYLECAECGEIFSSSYIHPCLRCEGDLVCDSCRGDHVEFSHEASEREYGQSIRGTSKGSFIDSPLLVGVEIEVEDISNCTKTVSAVVPQACGIHEDSSLCDGVEIVTPPRSLDLLEGMLQKTCRGLHSLKHLTVSDSCGLHIHMDANDIRSDMKVLTNVMLTYYYIEDLILMTQPNERRLSTYAVKLKRIFNEWDLTNTKAIDVTYYKDHKSSCENRKTQHGDGSRYYGVNLHSVFYRGTLEIRYHEGTMDYRDIIHWIDLNLSIFEYAKENPNIESLQALAKMEFTETLDTRLIRFFRIFNIKESTQKHMISRIKKYNPEPFHGMKVTSSLYKTICAA